MASLATDWGRQVSENPLDVLEALVQQEDWTTSRQSEYELLVACPGHWSTYQIHCLWLHDMEALHVSCGLEMTVPTTAQAPIAKLLGAINTKIWVGHFESTASDNAILFRHSLLLRGAGGATAEQVEDLIDIAVGECDRFFPAFQFVVWGGKTPEEAMAASLLDTKGQA
jgi:hypothetical protein